MGLSGKQIAQIDRAATAYQAAFARVKDLLGGRVGGSLPEFVFTLDRMDLGEVAVHSKEIAEAEQLRRQWRAALHAACELAALESGDVPRPGPRVQDTLDPDSLELDLASPSPGVDPAALPELDRFISVVQGARAAGCMYVDGTFAPVPQGRG